MQFTLRSNSFVLFLLLGLFLPCSTQESGIPQIVDINGNPVVQRNVTGCHYGDTQHNIHCPVGQIAPAGYVFILKEPSIQNDQNCSKCYSDSEPCYKICCSTDSTDCRLDTKPTWQLLLKVDTCAHHSGCSRLSFGWTSLTASETASCPSFREWTGAILSQLAELNYYCIDDEWEVYLDTDNSKTGQALFLTSHESFNDRGGWFNLSCAIHADEGSTIDFRAIDLRLCRDIADNKQSCGQRFHITENGSDVNDFLLEWTTNDDNGYLGFKHVYTSKRNDVTLRLDSERLTDAAHTFSVWLYIKPSSGNVTISCEAPVFFTTPTTTTTTTTTTAMTTTTMATTSNATSDFMTPSSAAESSSVTTEAEEQFHSTASVSSSPFTSSDVTRDVNDGGFTDRQGSKNDQDDTTLLFYHRLEVAGIAACLLCVFILILFSCYKWRIKQRRYRKLKKQKSRKLSETLGPLRNLLNEQQKNRKHSSASGTYNEATHSKDPSGLAIFQNPGFNDTDEMGYSKLESEPRYSSVPSKKEVSKALESVMSLSHEQERETEGRKHSSPSRREATDSKKAGDLAPGFTELDELDKVLQENQPLHQSAPPNGELSKTRSTSSQVKRSRLLDLLEEAVRSDSDVEASFREQAGSGADIRKTLEDLSTESLQELYDGVRQLQNASTDTFQF